MQKYNTPCINTGTFAKLCNTNKRTLIHYDEIGLFQPAFIDQKGYRYYSESQCDVFFTITCLKDLGMPLKEIRAYIEEKEPQKLTSLLLEQQKKVEEELQHLNHIKQVIKNKLYLVTEGSRLTFTHGCSEPFLTECEEELFIASPYLNTSCHEAVFSAICDHIGLVNHLQLNIGHPYGAVMETANLKKGITDTYAYFITRTKHPLPEQQMLQKKAGTYAVIYLQGNYYQAEEAFRRLLCFIEEQKLTAGAYCYKEAVWDELTVKTEEKYITKISIPVNLRDSKQLC